MAKKGRPAKVTTASTTGYKVDQRKAGAVRSLARDLAALAMSDEKYMPAARCAADLVKKIVELESPATTEDALS